LVSRATLFALNSFASTGLFVVGLVAAATLGQWMLFALFLPVVFVLGTYDVDVAWNFVRKDKQDTTEIQREMAKMIMPFLRRK